MQFGAWNVRTLVDTMPSNRPEPMTAIVAHELSRYNIDIAALSETRLAGTGDLAEVGTGYTFSWSSKAADEPREAGVGFAIRSVLIPKLEALPKGINYRLMTMRIPLAGNAHLTLISACAPTMTFPEEDKEQFYQVLGDTRRSMPGNDKLLLVGDFNERTGRNSGAWLTVMGPQAWGKKMQTSFCCWLFAQRRASPSPTPSSSNQKSTGSPGCTHALSTGTS